jgi:hypothetical protein
MHHTVLHRLLHRCTILHGLLHRSSLSVSNLLAARHSWNIYWKRQVRSRKTFSLILLRWNTCPFWLIYHFSDNPIVVLFELILIKLINMVFIWIAPRLRWSYRISLVPFVVGHNRILVIWVHHPGFHTLRLTQLLHDTVTRNYFNSVWLEFLQIFDFLRNGRNVLNSYKVTIWYFFDKFLVNSKLFWIINLSIFLPFFVN